MTRSREDLSLILKDILGVDHVYFSPPSNSEISYPCIIYKCQNFESVYADDKKYLTHKRYAITVIDPNPDSCIPEKLLEQMEYCESDRNYVVNGLYHFVFTLYF